MSAQSADVSGCPSSPCTPKISGNALQGWLKALSAQDGWDGWISLSGSGYGPTLSNGSFSGYAWGSNVVGWTDFSFAQTDFAPCTDHYYCSQNDLHHQSANCADAYVQTCSYQCAAGACIAPPPPAFNTGSNGLTGHLQVKPAIVRSGGTSTVYWDVSGVATCSVSGSNSDSWSGASSGSSGKTTSAITQQTTYTLSCTGLDSSSVHETATINILPVFQEL